MRPTILKRPPSCVRWPTTVRKTSRSSKVKSGPLRSSPNRNGKQPPDSGMGRKRTLPHRKNRTAEKSFLHTIIHVPIWFMDEIEYEPESNLALATSLEDSFFET